MEHGKLMPPAPVCVAGAEPTADRTEADDDEGSVDLLEDLLEGATNAAATHPSCKPPPSIRISPLLHDSASMMAAADGCVDRVRLHHVSPTEQSRFEIVPRGQCQQTSTGSAGIHEDADSGRVTAPDLQWLPRHTATHCRSLHLAIRGWGFETRTTQREDLKQKWRVIARLSLNFKHRADCKALSEILRLRLLTVSMRQALQGNGTIKATTILACPK